MKLRCNIDTSEEEYILYIEAKNKHGVWERVKERPLPNPISDKTYYNLSYLDYYCTSIGGGHPFWRVDQIKI